MSERIAARTASDREVSGVFLREDLDHAVDSGRRFIADARSMVSFESLRHRTRLGALEELAGRSILLVTRDQLAAAVAMMALDGIAARMVVCPPDVAPEHRPVLIAEAGIDAIVSDDTSGRLRRLGVPVYELEGPDAGTPPVDTVRDRPPTEWVLLTSGTTGAPKMLVHTLAGLTAAIERKQDPGTDAIWGTFYDIRRYGGLQVLLRALVGRGSLVVSDPAESPADHLRRLAAHGVTHLTGTPSHWRRVLMCREAGAIAPRYIRLSGEIVDQTILTALASVYPHARIGHAFASTETGVAFHVDDGRSGFPATVLRRNGDVDIRIRAGSLRIRSRGTASRYLGGDGPELRDEDGFVDTGDLVEKRDDRYYFLGRRTGMINVGGLKVYPEEVESVLNRHPAVRMSRAGSRPSPITGALVVADVVLDAAAENAEEAKIREEILENCRRALPRHKVPAALRFVPALDIAPTGKIARA